MGDGISDAMNMNLGKLREMVRDRKARRAAVHGVADSAGRLNSRKNSCLCGLWDFQIV